MSALPSFSLDHYQVWEATAQPSHKPVWPFTSANDQLEHEAKWQLSELFRAVTMLLGRVF